MLPTIAVKALEIARDPDCTVAEFTALVERDVKLAADILAMANSVMFSPGRTLSSLHQSVIRLGFRQCQNLILATSLSSLMKTISFQEEWIREILWRHSFLTAMLAVNVNHLLGTSYQGEEFAAGLIHDFGRTLFAVGLPEEFADIDTLEFAEDIQLLRHEEQLTGTNHSELGAWFAFRQRIPDELIDVIRYHHEPHRSSRYRRLVALISVCDHMANHLQRTGDTSGYDISTNTGLFLLEESGVKRAVDRIGANAVEVMRTAERDVLDMMC